MTKVSAAAGRKIFLSGRTSSSSSPSAKVDEDGDGDGTPLDGLSDDTGLHTISAQRCFTYTSYTLIPLSLNHSFLHGSGSPGVLRLRFSSHAALAIADAVWQAEKPDLQADLGSEWREITETRLRCSECTQFLILLAVRLGASASRKAGWSASRLR